MGAQLAYVHIFARLAPICMLSRCLLKKISASELSRKFIKSAFVGWAPFFACLASDRARATKCLVGMREVMATLWRVERWGLFKNGLF